MDAAMSETITTEESSPKAPGGASAWARELKALLLIGLPMGLTQLIQFSVNTVDVLMIGRLGPAPLAAASLGLVMFYTTFVIAFGPAMAVSPLVSHALGANRDETVEVRRSVRMGLWAAAIIFPVGALFYLNASRIALLLGQPPELARLAGPYVIAIGPSLPFMVGVIVLRNYLAAIERTRAPLLIIIFTTLENAFLNYLLIYGNFGFPRLELVGAGIASAISHATGFAILAFYVQFEKESARFGIFDHFFSPDWPRLREVMRLGWPIGVTMAFEV
ncbi:MAG TPA: MATE family efflux transporter, partial [Parvularculaceae bacterium]|nr:MATE family efflux transporter [Parvularculaceae bacterium]